MNHYHVEEASFGERMLAWGQGAFWFVSGIWPVLHMPSFEAITGPKTDDWLVRTVGLLIAAVGLGLLVAARRRRVSPEIIVVAVTAALALAAIDITYTSLEVIRWVYLLDAAVEILIALLWLWVSGWRLRKAG